MLRHLARAGLRRGILGGSRAWLAVGIAAACARLVVRVLRRDEEVVLREELPPGAALEIRHLEPGASRGR
ncbi:MAG: hypothetical protein C4344_05360 [Acidimicrobiia bacterium]